MMFPKSERSAPKPRQRIAPKSLRPKGDRKPLDFQKPEKEPTVATRKRVKRVNPERKAREFARTYHSKARVEWVKSLPCVWCRMRGLLPKNQHAGQCDNAHTESGGAGRKAGYETIVPLCRPHHEQYDTHAKPFDRLSTRMCIGMFARPTQAAWVASREYQGEE